MNVFKKFLDNIVRLGVVFVPLSFVLYLLSYSVYLRVAIDGATLDRASVIYRPAEFIIVHTPLREPMLTWAKFVSNHDQTELQLYFYCHKMEVPGDWISVDPN